MRICQQDSDLSVSVGSTLPRKVKVNVDAEQQKSGFDHQSHTGRNKTDNTFFTFNRSTLSSHDALDRGDGGRGMSQRLDELFAHEVNSLQNHKEIRNCIYAYLCVLLCVIPS